MRLSAPLLFALVPALLCACGGAEGEEGGRAVEAVPPTAAGPASPRAPLDADQRALQGLAVQAPRSREPGVLEAIAALERLDLAGATRALNALGDGLDEELLRVRLAGLEDDSVGAVRRIEALRARFPGQARVFAVAAEVHAAAGRLRSAEEEVREGLARCGPTPTLSRARGVLALSREGGARVGLNHLLEARAADPQLPFLDRPLAQAHLLLGRLAMAQEQPLDAVGHARAALSVAPGDVEARTLLADGLASTGGLDEALALFEELLGEGQPVRDTLALLSQRAATAALVEGRREVAVERHLRARELGLPVEELGFGATLLAQEAERALADGAAAYERGEIDLAAERFERALQLDPGSLAAENHLGVVRFKQGRYAAAAQRWRAVLERSREQGLELPEPVHLNLARALVLDQRTDEARTLLEDELGREPGGTWADEAREMLARLEDGGG